MTNLEKFIETFGIYANDVKLEDCDGFYCRGRGTKCVDCKRYRFWEQEYIEPKEKSNEEKFFNFDKVIEIEKQKARVDAIDNVKQFLYAHRNIGYTELLEFLDNLEEQK